MFGKGIDYSRTARKRGNVKIDANAVLVKKTTPSCILKENISIDGIDHVPQASFKCKGNQVSAFVKRKKNTQSLLPTSDDEKGLDGAPEGELYQVEVIEDCHLLEPMKDPTPALANVLRIAAQEPNAITDSSSTWVQQFDALTSIRRLCVYHPEIMKTSLYGKKVTFD